MKRLEKSFENFVKNNDTCKIFTVEIFEAGYRAALDDLLNDKCVSPMFCDTHPWICEYADYEEKIDNVPPCGTDDVSEFESKKGSCL